MDTLHINAHVFKNRFRTDFSFYFAALNVNNKGQEVIKAISQERRATTKAQALKSKPGITINHSFVMSGDVCVHNRL